MEVGRIQYSPGYKAREAAKWLALDVSSLDATAKQTIAVLSQENAKLRAVLADVINDLRNEGYTGWAERLEEGLK